MIVAVALFIVIVSDEAVITSALPTLKLTPVAVSVSVDALPKLSNDALPKVIVSALPVTVAAALPASVIVSLEAVAVAPPCSVTFCFVPAIVAVSPQPSAINPALPVSV